MAAANSLTGEHRQAAKPGAPASPVISVVMSVYNGGQFLKAAVRSILDQSFKDFEFIIIDDGSTDDTAATVQSFKDPRIRLLRQSNQGLVAALNRGVSVAKAEFIARMDADDISLPDRLEAELAAMTANPKVAVVGTFFNYIDASSKKRGHTVTSPTLPIDLKRSLYIVNPFGHGSTLIRKSAIMAAGGYSPDYGPTEDYELWRRIAKDWELAIIPRVLYHYRINSQGISQLGQKEQHAYAAKIVEEQWRQPFVSKSIGAILADGRYYKSMDSQFAMTIYNQYVHQQYLLAMGLFVRGHFWTGLSTAIAACRMDRRQVRRLWRPAIGGLMRGIGLKARQV